MRPYNYSLRSVIGVATALTLITPEAVLAQVANTAYGTQALGSNSGSYNSAFGSGALLSNSSGNGNTASGTNALYYNTVGSNNTASGSSSLLSNTTGSYNTSNGAVALYYNTTGGSNMASGAYALYYNTTGSGNSASGTNALAYNTTGNNNTASGDLALYLNTSGLFNTASGSGALYANTIGTGNTACGANALSSNTTGNYNIGVGFGAGINLTTGGNNIDIGNSGTSADYGTVRIGSDVRQTFIAGISGVAASGGVQVYINSAGQLGTLTSSQRFKKDIKSIDSASDKLLQLRPVSFIYKEDDNKQLQYGLIAEEVAKVYPELVQYDKKGKPFTVYYHLLTPLLLREVQKEHAMNVSQQEKLEAQQTQLANLTTVEAQQQAKLKDQSDQLVSLNQKLNLQYAEMTALQQKLNRLDELLQANNVNAVPDAKVALVTKH